MRYIEIRRHTEATSRHLRLLEGLAQPHEEDELNLSYYNSATTWIRIDGLLQLFGLTREELMQADDLALLTHQPEKETRRRPQVGCRRRGLTGERVEGADRWGKIVHGNDERRRRRLTGSK